MPALPPPKSRRYPESTALVQQALDRRVLHRCGPRLRRPRARARAASGRARDRVDDHRHGFRRHVRHRRVAGEQLRGVRVAEDRGLTRRSGVPAVRRRRRHRADHARDAQGLRAELKHGRLRGSRRLDGHLVRGRDHVLERTRPRRHGRPTLRAVLRRHLGARRRHGARRRRRDRRPRASPRRLVRKLLPREPRIRRRIRAAARARNVRSDDLQRHDHHHHHHHHHHRSVVQDLRSDRGRVRARVATVRELRRRRPSEGVVVAQAQVLPRASTCRALDGAVSKATLLLRRSTPTSSSVSTSTAPTAAPGTSPRSRSEQRRG